MAYSKKDKDRIFTEICKIISEEGLSLRKAIKKHNTISRETFFVWMDEDETKSKSDQYARAKENRADYIFEEIIAISDDDDDDEKAFVGQNHIQRDRLRMDARKWVLSKMLPKKYGDKIDHTSSDGSMSPKPTIINKSDKNIDISNLTNG